MKRIIKILVTLITLIIVNYNMCFADLIDEPRISGHGDLSEIITLILPLIFILGISLIIIEMVTYIYKKKKSEETQKIEDIINKTNIFLAIVGSLFIFLFLVFQEVNFWGITFIIGSILAIIARKKKQVEISNIICGLIVIFSIPTIFSIFLSSDMLSSQTNDTRRSSYTTI